MDLPLLSKGRVNFQIKGCQVVFFIFIQIVKQHSVNKHLRNPAQTPRSVVSDLGLCPLKRTLGWYGLSLQ